MQKVKPKKHLGQHFLADENIARKICNALSTNSTQSVLEIGPGTGVLSKHLMERQELDLWLADVDVESIAFLKENYPEYKDRILHMDFLRANLNDYTDDQLSIIGNFPYNISSQIYFKVLENRKMVPECVGMIQKEVAERICSKEGNKIYGILSVLIQAFYHTEYLFEVSEKVFIPPPKVKSAVIRLVRKDDFTLDCDEKLFFRVVKAAFNTRRKTLRNALKSLNLPEELKSHPFMGLRAEQLKVEDFVELTKLVQ